MAKWIATAVLTAVGLLTLWARADEAREASDARDANARKAAQVILDSASSDAQREAALASEPKLAVEIVAQLAANLKGDDAKEEYRRIPWIWRAAVAAGRRNDADELRRLLKVALPQDGRPMRDWQAVVLGGGVVNGISDQNVYPAGRIEGILKDDAALMKRWRHAIDRAFAMAADE